MVLLAEHNKSEDGMTTVHQFILWYILQLWFLLCLVTFTSVFLILNGYTSYFATEP